MKIKLLLLALFASVLFAACSDNDEPAVTPEIPSTKAEIDAALQKKWDINTADSQYKTILFKANSIYNLEKTNGDIIVGSYFIDEETKTLVMSGLGIIGLTKLTSDKLEFNLLLSGEDKAKSYSCTPTNSIGEGKELKFLYLVADGDDDLLYTCDENGENNTLVIRENYIEEFTWYPDGSKVLFMNDIEDVAYLYRVNINGSGKASVYAPKGIERFVITPDAKTLVYVDSRNIFTIGLDGSNKKQLTTFGENKYVLNMGLSVDGKTIVYSMSYDNKQSIYTMNIDGGNTKKVIEKDLYLYDVQLSPNSKYIVYGAGSDKLFVCDIDGNNDKLIYSNTSPNSYLYYPYFHPDGNSIYFSMSLGKDMPQTLHSINLDGSGLKNYNVEGVGKFIPLSVAKK